MKKRFGIICILLVLALFFSSCAKVVKWNGKTEYFAELYMVSDISDLYSYVGLVDNVFAGTVTGIEKNVLNKRDGHEGDYSIYDIRVDKNLKGELVENVVCKKLGGMKQNGTMQLVSAETPDGRMINDTGLPEVGKQYIFMSYSQPDGSLVLSEIFDNRECTGELLLEYADYIENEVYCERERFSSVYDK